MVAEKHESYSAIRRIQVMLNNMSIPHLLMSLTPAYIMVCLQTSGH